VQRYAVRLARDKRLQARFSLRTPPICFGGLPIALCFLAVEIQASLRLLVGVADFLFIIFPYPLGPKLGFFRGSLHIVLGSLRRVGGHKWHIPTCNAEGRCSNDQKTDGNNSDYAGCCLNSGNNFNSAAF